MSGLTIPAHIDRAHAHGELSHAELALLVAMLRSGEIRMGDDGIRYVYASNLGKLPGAPSQRWLDQNLDRLVAGGWIGVVDPAWHHRGSGRARRCFRVRLEERPSELFPQECAPRQDGAQALARAGHVNIITSNNNNTTTSTSRATSTTPAQSSSAFDSQASPEDLEVRLLRILSIEGVSAPEDVIREHPLNTVAYAVKKLFEKVQRGEEFTHGRANYLAKVLREHSRRPQVLTFDFLKLWEQEYTERQTVIPFRRATPGRHGGTAS